MCIPEYEFSKPTEENDYRLFSEELENNPHVAFHGTPSSNFEPIVANGFNIPASFAKNSSEALRHAYLQHEGAELCILVVRFDSLDGLADEGPHLQLHDPDPKAQPKMIGRMVIPADYKFL